MTYLLGVDIGTTSVKAIAFSDRGEIIFKCASDYEMKHPQLNYSELSADEILNATFFSISKIIDTLHPSKPSFISFSAMMHSLIAVDQQGNPLTECIIWADNRAASIAEQLRNTEEGERYYHITGVPLHAMSPLCKLLWLKEHEPDIFFTAHKFIGIKEYIFFRLFNTYVTDTSIASATGLLNIYSLQWDKSVLNMLELPEEKLPKVVPVDQIFYFTEAGISHSLKLSNETPFVIGGSDGALANLGTGSIENNSMAITIGTSAAVRILCDQPGTDKKMSTFCYHVMAEQYIIGGASNNGAVVLKWLKESLLQTSESYEQLFQLAESVDISDDLFFVPYILGERAPVWDANAKGIFSGFTINNTKAHLVRAAMEGITFNLYSIGKSMMETSAVKEIYATGGFAQSPLWLQLLADVFNCRVLVSGSLESSALGAVMVGIKAFNIPITIRPQIVSEHEPNFLNHEVYLKKFQKFERLYKLLKNEFAATEHSVTHIPIS